MKPVHFTVSEVGPRVVCGPVMHGVNATSFKDKATCPRCLRMATRAIEQEKAWLRSLKPTDQESEAGIKEALALLE